MNVTAVAACNGPQCGIYFNEFVTNADYRVLDTDYINYAIIYSCVPIFGQDFATILTRARNPDQRYIERALSVIYQRIPGYYFSNLVSTYQGSAC